MLTEFFEVQSDIIYVLCENDEMCDFSLKKNMNLLLY